MSGDVKTISRRAHLRFLGSAAAGAALAGVPFGALAQNAVPARAPANSDVENYDFLIARVRFDSESTGSGARWNVYPGGDRNLLAEFAEVVRAKVKIPTGCNNTSPDHGDESTFNAVVTFDQPERLADYPFLFMTGEGHFTFSRQQKAGLKTHVEQGGFLLIDDCVWAPDGDFLYQSAYEMLESVFGHGSVVTVPNSHEIFTSVYDLSDAGLPYCQGKNHGAKGVFLGDRLAVFLSSTDIHCGWADRTHAFFPPPRPGYAESIRMGINIIMYAMSH